MTIEESLFAALSGDADVGPLVAEATSPVQHRIYPNIAPDNVRRPYIVYFIVSGEHSQTLTGRNLLKRARVQVDCVADTYPAARALADHVYDAVDTNMKAGMFTEQSTYLDEVELHVISLDLALWK